jgi:hypothetical protein
VDAGLGRPAPPPDFLDHLVLAVPDLAAGIEHVHGLLGVRATPGGRHFGEGTRNALLSMGRGSYLEILGPDPEQAAPPAPRWLGVDAAAVPRLTAWAARGADLEALVRRARSSGVPLGNVSAGSRTRPDGAVLSWKFTDPRVLLFGGVVPFFIDWRESPHPSETAAAGAELVGLSAEHPEPESVRAALRVLGISLPVAAGPAPALGARIRGAHGIVELR